MKLVGVGIDLTEMGRFARLPYRKNRLFYEKIFSRREISYCLSKANPAQHFAGRFAAKEAVVKALGSTIFKINQIEITTDKSGKPSVRIRNQESGIRILISLGHAKDYAVAVAVAYS